MESKIGILRINIKGLAFFDYYSKLEIKISTKVKIELNFRENHSSIQEMIDNFEVYRTNYNKFNEIKELSYIYCLSLRENEISKEIIKQILTNFEGVNLLRIVTFNENVDIFLNGNLTKKKEKN